MSTKKHGGMQGQIKTLRRHHRRLHNALERLACYVDCRERDLAAGRSTKVAPMLIQAALHDANSALDASAIALPPTSSRKKARRST